MPVVSIIIPTCKSSNLKPLLESIVKYTDLSNKELIIIANGYDEPLYNDPSQNRTVIWHKERVGYTNAVIEGISKAKGEFVVLLNDDTRLLEQPKDNWIEVLKAPFQDPKVGITGPMKTYCPYTEREFLIFFCVCIRKTVLDQIGIDPIFNPGYGEDSDFCAKLEDAGYTLVQTPPSDKYFPGDAKRMVGGFPIWHEGNVTFKNWPEGDKLLAKNNQILKQRHSKVDISRAVKCDGFMTDNELLWLGRRAKASKVFIEVGSWHGKSSRAIGDNLPEGSVVYCVDTWKGSQAEQSSWHLSASWKDGDHAYYEFLQNNIDLVQSGKMIPIRMSSKNAADFFKEKGITADTIFIDGGHTYQEVKDDINMWEPLVQEGGVFCGHDYIPHGNGWIEVKQAVDELIPNVSVGHSTTIWNTVINNKGKVYDCFPFFNELDLLEARFNELYDVVDRFVITEATLTHGGQPKPLYFRENLKRFEKFLHKVTHIVVEKYPALDSWSIERHQRDRLMDGLTQCKDNDIIIVGDADEIPKAEVIKNYRIEQGLSCIRQKLYYYQLNCQATQDWDWLRILPYSIMKKMSPCQVRYTVNYDLEKQIIKDGGWHFSYIASIDGIIEKIKASAHQEYNKPEYTDKERVTQLVKEGKDLFGRNLTYKHVQIDESYPKFIRDNPQIYAPYIV